MDEPPEIAEGPKRRYWIPILVLLVLYPLSFGPAIYLYSHEHVSSHTHRYYVLPVYRPLGWITESNPTLDALCTEYARWWANLPPLPPRHRKKP